MTNESEFQVAILLPVQGSDDALDRTVASVRAQTETRWTLWLIETNDACGRAERWLGTDPRIQRLRHAGRGRAAALGQALARCPGDYLVFLDAEHGWEPGFLALTTAFLRANPLEDLVCMEAVTPSGQPAVVRRPVFRERGVLRDALREALDLPAQARSDAALDSATWYRGELAQHLRWGEYSRMAVTLMTSEAALRLAPALGRESAALDYRLQARLARTCVVNLLALTGAVQRPAVWSAAQELQQERDALEVFDEIHGRQREIDPEVARLRRERLARLQRPSALRLLGHGFGLARHATRVVMRFTGLSGARRASGPAPLRLGGPPMHHPR
jgi:hypothetical protein